MTQPVVQIVRRAPRLAERAMKFRIGFIILATDHTAEIDIRRLLSSDQIGTYVTRIPYANPTTPENLRAMQPSVTAAAELILPGDELDIVVFSCTSASAIIGNDEIERAIKKAKPSAVVVTPTTAAVQAFQALGAERISILAPYTVETTQAMTPYFASQKVLVDRLTCLNIADDREMARVEPHDLIAFAEEATAPESDALFISCTSVRSVGIAAQIEDVISRPVITSNLATAWACLRLCGEPSRERGNSRLFQVDAVVE